MADTTADLLVPRISTMPTEGVTREKGFLGLETSANIEVKEIDPPVAGKKRSGRGGRRGITLVDVSEVSQALRASTQLLFGYKFLTTNFLLGFGIKKHGDCDVLVASVESAQFEVTVSPHGKSVYRGTFKVRNTQKQYLRVELPELPLAPESDQKSRSKAESFQLWSTLLDGAPIKPAKDDDGALLLPLRKMEAGSKENAKFSVQLTYLHTAPEAALGDAGTLRLHFPRVDVPINRAQVTVRVPHDGYTWEDFEGNLKPAPYGFYGGLAAGGEQFMKNDMDGLMPMQQVQMSNAIYDEQNMSNPMFEEQQMYDSMSFDSMDDFDEAPASSGKREQAPAAQGLLPVNVDFPAIGQVHQFERTIVVPHVWLKLEADYTFNEKKTRRKKRSLDKKSCC